VLAVGTFARGSHGGSCAPGRCSTGTPSCSSRTAKPIEDNLRRERISVEEIAAQARLQQLDSLQKIRWAILETSGEISFILKSGG
jgi:YetF C-terminal domain